LLEIYPEIFIELYPIDNIPKPTDALLRGSSA